MFGHRFIGGRDRQVIAFGVLGLGTFGAQAVLVLAAAAAGLLAGVAIPAALLTNRHFAPGACRQAVVAS